MIRKATTQDIDAVTNIYLAIHDAEEKNDMTIGWVRDIYPTRKTAADAAARGDLFVEVVDDRIVASAIINQTQVPEYADCTWEYPAEDSDVMVLHTLVVHPDERGHGFGKVFVRFYEQYAKQQGCHYARMDTQEKNAAARKMYAGLGYKEPGIVPCNFNGISEVSLVCLEKKLEKVGLVLEGGAMRGMYTAGVLDIFMEQGISVDSVIGVSAGALFGVNYLSGQKGRVIRYNKRFNQDKNYMGLRPLLREGNIVSTKYAYDIVPRKLDPFDDKTYQNSPIPFFAVVTDIHTGKPEYIKIDSVFRQMDTLRASGSMPFVSKPVRIDGKDYLDGGIADSIPFQWMHDSQDCEKMIVILTRDIDYRKKPMSKALIRLYARKYPQLAKPLFERHKTYNDAVEKLLTWEKEGRALIIRPSKPIEIGRMETDPAKLQSVYELGRKDGTAQIVAVKNYL